MNIDLSNFLCFDEIQCFFPTLNTRMKSSRQNNFKMNCSFPHYGLFSWCFFVPREMRDVVSNQVIWEEKIQFLRRWLGTIWLLSSVWTLEANGRKSFSIFKWSGETRGWTLWENSSKRWIKTEYLIKKSICHQRTRPIGHPQFDLGTRGPSWWFLGEIINTNENSTWYKCVTNWKNRWSVDHQLTKYK